jgi:ABC-type uncharacterized transport system permease subunit
MIVTIQFAVKTINEKTINDCLKPLFLVEKRLIIGVCANFNLLGFFIAAARLFAGFFFGNDG